MVGILGSFFESFLGVSPPIIPDKVDEFRKRPVDQAPIVTKMILMTEHGEEPTLADPAEPLPINHQGTVSEGAAEPGLNRAQEREVEEGKRAMEDDTMSVDDDLENAETLEHSADQAPEAGDDDTIETPAQKQENESWQ